MTFLSAIIGFVGTVLGVAIAGVVAWAIHRAQRHDVLDKERRDRNAGAASRASQALDSTLTTTPCGANSAGYAA